MIGTFILALLYTTVYLRERNLFALGLFHGWLGALFYYTVVGRDPYMEVFRQFAQFFELVAFMKIWRLIKCPRSCMKIKDGQCFFNGYSSSKTEFFHNFVDPSPFFRDNFSDPVTYSYFNDSTGLVLAVFKE